MLKTYIAAASHVKGFFADKKGVSHLLEVVGILALAALILVTVFPGANTKITDIWNQMLSKINTATSGLQ
jgi:Flp pilus assembly pilin Flp